MSNRIADTSVTTEASKRAFDKTIASHTCRAKQWHIVATELHHDKENAEYIVRAFRLGKNGCIVRYAACDVYVDTYNEAVESASLLRENRS